MAEQGGAKGRGETSGALWRHIRRCLVGEGQKREERRREPGEGGPSTIGVRVSLVPDGRLRVTANDPRPAPRRAGPTQLRRRRRPPQLPAHQPRLLQVLLPVGLLDSDPGIPLKHHIHVNSKAPWEVLDGETRQHPEGLDS